MNRYSKTGIAAAVATVGVAASVPVYHALQKASEYQDTEAHAKAHSEPVPRNPQTGLPVADYLRK